MKIFLCSTAHDLLDFRAKIIDILSKRGHEVIFHESPTFPAKIGLHSHDQCVLAVKECDMVLCVLDKRYGGEYHGELLQNEKPVKVEISGKDKKGQKLTDEIEVPIQKMSITWCELQQGYASYYTNNTNVITFVRQRTLDEKATRRHNQSLKDFKPAYAERNELFDLIDWITKQERNNWIVSFNNIVDFEEKLIIYINEYDKQRLNTSISKKDFQKRICIIVEGEIDRLVVQNLIRKTKIEGDFVIIPSYGKYRLLQNLNNYINPFANSFDQVIVLIDTDAKNFGQFDTFIENIRKLQENLAKNNVRIFWVNPEIEAWIVAGLNEKLYREHEGFIQKEVFSGYFGASTIDTVRQLMKKYNIGQAIQVSSDLADFVGALRQYATNEIRATE